MSLFNKIIPFCLEEEGGYVWHPQDPGGETNFGISKRSYPHLDIKNLTQSQAVEIYRQDYWKPAWEKLGFPLAACMLDTAINMGHSRATSFLSKSQGNYTTFLRLRSDRYDDLIKNNPKLQVFAKGWQNRLVRLRKFIEANNTGNFIYNGNRKDIT